MARQHESKRANDVTVSENQTKRSSRHLFMLALLCLLLIQTVLPVHAALPGFRAPILDTPSTPSTFRSGLSDNPNSSLAAVTPEIEELARSLRYNPGLMYKFVHDFVETELTWGETKGAHMTWLDRSGNSFDQATLMIRLLEEAQDHNADLTITNILYVVGEIELTQSETADVFDLPLDADATNAILARSGIYADVSETAGNVTAVDMEHVWVKVTIDSTTYEFDPSFKSHTYNFGLYDYVLEAAMDYDQSDFETNAVVDSNSDVFPTWIKNVNETNINADLTTFTTELIDYLKVNEPHSSVEDIISGRQIDAVDENDLPPSSVPYTVESEDDGFSIDNVPNLYRTTLRIRHEGIDETLYSSDIYGRRLVI